MAYAANGNVTAANDLKNGSWSYAYDEFNRLCEANKGGTGTPTCAATPTGATTGYKYDFDRYGDPNRDSDGDLYADPYANAYCDRDIYFNCYGYLDRNRNCDLYRDRNCYVYTDYDANPHSYPVTNAGR